jgi:hypothetical protein
MQCEEKRCVFVCTDSDIRDRAYYNRLWLAARNLNIPRRKWLDELADCFCAFSGEIFYPSGERYEIPMIDETFGDDCDCRWLSYYLKPDETGNRPVSRSRMYERIRLIDLYIRIRHPNIAAHFSK